MGTDERGVFQNMSPPILALAIDPIPAGPGLASSRCSVSWIGSFRQNREFLLLISLFVVDNVKRRKRKKQKERVPRGSKSIRLSVFNTIRSIILTG